MRWLASLVTGLFGCAGDPPSDDAPPDTDAVTPGDDDDDTVPLGTDEASVVVMAFLPTATRPDPTTLLTGMFVESRNGFLNLGQCVGAPDSFCVTQWPTVEDEFVLVQDFDPVVLTTLDTRNVGGTLTIGPWSANYTADTGSGLGFYYSSTPGVVLPDYPYDLSFEGGTWDPYSGSSDISAPTHIDLTSFDPLTEAVLYDSDPVPLRWVADPDHGDVYLAVRTPLEDRLYLLADDGSFDLDLTPIGLQDGDEVELMLGRWTTTVLDIDGNDLQLLVQSNQRITGTWRAIGPRVELTDLYDTCAEAEISPAVPEGNYFGDFSSFANDLNPGPTGCTSFPAPGSDAIVPIELQPDELLEVTYKLPSDDASVYLLADCDVVTSCLFGADRTIVAGTESDSYLNTTGAPVRVYLVLDAFDDATAPFDLTITITPLGGDILVPTCLEAIEQGPIVTGDYHGRVGGNADYLDPTCAGGAAGGEGLVEVFLEAGETLTADVIVTGGADAKMYLLSNCAIADSCFFTADAEGGVHEQLVYTNTGASSAWFYLVLDGDTNPDEYLLNVVVQ